MAKDEHKKTNASEVAGEGMLLVGRAVGLTFFSLMALVTGIVAGAAAYYAGNYEQYIEDMEKERRDCIARREAGRPRENEDCEASDMSKGGLIAVSVIGVLCCGLSVYGIRKVWTSDRVASAFAVGWIVSSFSRRY